LADRVLDFSKEGDLLVENFERRVAGDNTVEDLLAHVVEVKGLFFDAGILTVFASAGGLELLAEDFLEGITGVEEVLEADLELFLPQELLVVVLLEEVVGSLLDFVQVVGHVLELAHQKELILDFVQEITVGGVKTGHLGGQGDEILNNLVDDVTDTVLALIAHNGGFKEHVVALEVHLDVEDGLEAVVLIVLDGELLQEVLHRAVDTFSDAVDDEAVEVVDVLAPCAGSLVGTDGFHGVFHELLDLLTVGTDFFNAGTNHSGVSSFNILSKHGLVLALVKGLIPLLHHVVHLVDVLLHLLDELVNLGNNLQGIADELVNVVAVPAELSNSGLKSVAHLLDAVSEEGLLDGEKSGKDFVVHVNAQFQVAGLSAVQVNLTVKGVGAFGNFNVEQFEVLDFTEKADEDGVEVDANEALFGKLGLLAEEQELVELFVGVLFNTSFPLADLLVIELLKVLDERVVELLDVFVLFTLENGSGELAKTFHWVGNTLVETLGPVKSTSNGGSVAGDGRALVNALNEDLTLKEDLLDALQVLLEEFKEGNMLALDVILNDGAVEEALKGIEQLELANDGVAVVEGLGDNRGETALKLLDGLAEVEEVVIELTVLDVHDVVGDGHELINDKVEFVKNLGQRLAHGGTLGVTNFDLAELLELLDGASQVHDVHAAFREGVKTNEESVGGDLPLVLRLGLVVEVGVLELGADLKSKGKLAVGVSGVIVLDGIEDLLSINEVLALSDNSIADFTDENNEAGRSVVVVGVLPNEQDSVHDRHKQVGNLGQLKGGGGQIVEETVESLQVLEVLVRFLLGDLHFLLELREGSGVGRLVLLEELEHLLDALGVQLLADLVQVLRLRLPELKLGQGVGVLVVLESVLGVLLEHVLDLLLPVDDGSFQDVSLVLGRGALRRGHVAGGKGQQGAALDLANGDVGVSQELVELVHQVLADKVRPANLVHGVAEHGKEHLKAGVVEVLEDGAVELHEDDLILNASGEARFFGLRAGFNDQKSLALDFYGCGRIQQEFDVLTTGRVHEKELIATRE
jgi:hypothetical protein